MFLFDTTGVVIEILFVIWATLILSLVTTMIMLIRRFCLTNICIYRHQSWFLNTEYNST